MPHEWDAATYDRVAAGIKALGHEVLARLELSGDERVLDAGCGPGEVTAALRARLPRGRVLAVDASPRMVAAARERLGGAADVRMADLLELAVEEPVDAILSTATFHWIADHDRLFRRLRAALRPGGRLVAQCGGAGNLGALRDAIAASSAELPFAAHLGGFDPWTFAGADETERRLRAAGFATARCWLEDRLVIPDDAGAYLESVILGAHLERLPVSLRTRFVEVVVARTEQPLSLPYVRLNIDANA
jgi:trans-aconitate 2-methyltransferase